MKQLPAWTTIEDNLRDLLVLKAEELYLTAGGDLGTALVEQLTGVGGVDHLPSDFFLEDRSAIRPELLEVTEHLRKTRRYVTAGALGWSLDSDRIDGDYLGQQHTDFIELFLASIPHLALGAWDGTNAHHGAVNALWRAGVAWSRLVEFIDEATSGTFEHEPLTTPDLALLGGLAEGSMRNIVGPVREIRTAEVSGVRRGRPRVGARAFASVRGTDALAWLRTRKSFMLQPPRPGVLSDRLDQIEPPETRGRAALAAALVLGETFDTLAAALGDVPHARLRAIGDGVADVATERLVALVEQRDRGRSSDTAPAMPEG